MKRTFLLSVICCCCWAVLWAQQRKIAEKPKPKVKYFPVYLGNSDKNSGVLPVGEFSNLINEGLRAKDSLNREGKIEGFTFIYKERNLYEDSAGNYIINVDVTAEECVGNKLSQIALSYLGDHIKKGDTVLIENISVLVGDTIKREGQPMRIVLSK